MTDDEQQTRWQVHTLPRQDGVRFQLFLTTPTADPDVIAKIEKAARDSGMLLTRVAS